MIGLRFGSYVEGRHLERELEIARRVQQDLLPAARQTRSEYFDVAADCVPAKGVGGDFYDVFSTAGGGSAFVLGDVSGKGVPAALLAGVIHGAVRSTSWTDGADHHEAATSRINQLLCERASRERYATMFWSYFDSQEKLLHYINAGHFPPLLVRAGKAIRLSEGGPVLGMLPDAIYCQGCVRIEPGDLLVIYSDGIIETTGSRDEPFGEKRLLEAVEFCSHQNAQGIRNQILASVGLFARVDEPEDDRTLLVIRHIAAAAGHERCALPAEESMSFAGA
jgi:sigma-B regulation protein RsbU (phosphoserine phosphatase)